MNDDGMSPEEIRLNRITPQLTPLLVLQIRIEETLKNFQKAIKLLQRNGITVGYLKGDFTEFLRITCLYEPEEILVHRNSVRELLEKMGVIHQGHLRMYPEIPQAVIELAAPFPAR